MLCHRLACNGLGSGFRVCGLHAAELSGPVLESETEAVVLSNGDYVMMTTAARVHPVFLQVADLQVMPLELETEAGAVVVMSHDDCVMLGNEDAALCRHASAMLSKAVVYLEAVWKLASLVESVHLRFKLRSAIHSKHFTRHPKGGPSHTDPSLEYIVKCWLCRAERNMQKGQL